MQCDNRIIDTIRTLEHLRGHLEAIRKTSPLILNGEETVLMTPKGLEQISSVLKGCATVLQEVLEE